MNKQVSGRGRSRKMIRGLTRTQVTRGITKKLRRKMKNKNRKIREMENDTM
jgi:hypothetical protein